MQASDFLKRAPGLLSREEGPEGQYLAFTPNPLPPKFRFDSELIGILSRADQALGELRGVGRMLPNPHLLIRPFLGREAVASSRIEGTVTNLEELFIFEASPREDEMFPDRQEVSNYVRAMEYGLKRIESLPISLRLIRELHGRLMAGVRGVDKTPGEFRRLQNAIAREGRTAASARFVPPPVRELARVLDEFESFVGNPSGMPVLIDLALIHYQFETIHPFLDGNGRLGRLLISLMLCTRGCLTQPLLYLSGYLEERRGEYVDRLLAVSQKGTWEGWIRFFLEAVARQSAEGAAACHRLLELRDRYRKRATAVGRSAQLLVLVDILFDAPAITIGGAQELLGLSYPATQANVEKLVKLGILHEMTGRPTNRVYLASEILALLDRPTPPSDPSS